MIKLPNELGALNSSNGEERCRYSKEKLLSLKHERRLLSINGYMFSKHANEQSIQVQEDDAAVVDEDGYLRTSDVLIVDDAGADGGEKKDATVRFSEMRLPPELVEGFRYAKYVNASPVQYRGIPVARLGVDVIAQAKSGTGKTLVFSSIVVQLALTTGPGRISSLILAPTREIAAQLGTVLSTIMRGARKSIEAKENAEINNASGKSNENMEKAAAQVAEKPNQGDGDMKMEIKAGMVSGKDDGNVDVVPNNGGNDDSNSNEQKNNKSRGRKKWKESAGDEVAVLMGGSPDRFDAPLLEKATVAVGTPARVRALLLKGIFEPNSIQLLVLDEVDRLMDCDAGFGLGDIVSRLPSRRQSMAFSATYTPNLVSNLRALMREPKLVWLGDQGPADKQIQVNNDNGLEMSRSAVLRGVKQWKIIVDANGKNGALIRILRNHQYGGCIIFVGTRDDAKEITKEIRRRIKRLDIRYVTAALTNKQRKQALALFEKGKVKVIVCTDMLARGVNLKKCDCVIQMDVPNEINTYLHRVGRAGRFGTQATSFVIADCERDRNEMAAIEAHIGKIPVYQNPSPKKRERTAGGIESPKKKMRKRNEGYVEESDDCDLGNGNRVGEKRPEKDVKTTESINEVRDRDERIEDNYNAKDDADKGFMDGYAAAREMIARIQAYRQP